MTVNAELTPSPREDLDDSPLRALESKAVRGTYFVTISYGLALALRLVSSIVLSRLFAPELFGVLTLVSTIILGMYLFSHIGLQDSIIQDPRGDNLTFLNTAWTVQVVRGIALFLITIPLAWPVAHFYHDSRLLWVLPALGFGNAISGFTSTSLLSLARHLGVGKISALELLQQIVQFVVTLVWALYQPSLMALVAGRLISELVRTIASYFLMPELRPRFTWHTESLRALVKFGRWILIGTGLTFLAGQSDRLILAKLISFQLLGIYGIAFQISDVPRQIILQFCGRVGFPFIARFSARPRREYQDILLKYRKLVLALGGLMLILVICTGDLFITHVYDHRYHAAAWMIGILALGLWHTLLYSTTFPAILSLQKAHYNALGYFVYCVSLYIALPVGFHFLGMTGAVLAVAVADLPMYFVGLYSAYRERIRLFAQDAWLTLAFVVSLAAALALRWSLGFGSPFAGIPW
ncbi:MAG: oligosaccharide flippase family protein [Silvibacterium sp.]|nr:oligosaccharide flippase family protein [Silvibacterium sp.]